MERIPVTIITGFLGSGKTTLLNHILAQNTDLKIAIIENEFGELSIDQMTIENSQDGIYELNNGCICCSLNGEMITILSKLMNREEPPQYLIIETTGLADPSAIISAFINDVLIQTAFELDSIVTLVDAKHYEHDHAQAPEMQKQIALADCILLNKMDLVSEEEVNRIELDIQIKNPTADLYRTTNANCEKNLLYRRSFRVEQVQTSLHKSPRFQVNHLANTASKSLVFQQPFDFLLFNNWMNYQLNALYGNIYRCKGVLWVEHFEQKVIFQGVGDQVMVQMGAVWGDAEDKKSTLVFIGQNLQSDLIEQALIRCLSTTEI